MMGSLVGFGFSGSEATAARIDVHFAPLQLPTGEQMAPPLPIRVALPEPTEVDALAPGQFAESFEQDVESIGSLSIGRANRGFLFNGVAMPESPRWIIVEPEHAFGTEETVQSLSHAINAVNALYPETPPLYVGHISRKSGGWLRPHRSHQSGRDVDLGFYYLGGAGWYQTATADNFDVLRNWALISALMKTSPVEYVFIDRSLHEPLKAQAQAVGETEAFITEAFDGVEGVTQPLIRHARGHDDHMHIRFASPAAVGNAQRARAVLGRAAYNGGVMLKLLVAKKRKQQKS